MLSNQTRAYSVQSFVDSVINKTISTMSESQLNDSSLVADRFMLMIHEVCDALKNNGFTSKVKLNDLTTRNALINEISTRPTSVLSVLDSAVIFSKRKLYFILVLSDASSAEIFNNQAVSAHKVYLRINELIDVDSRVRPPAIIAIPTPRDYDSW